MMDLVERMARDLRDKFGVQCRMAEAEMWLPIARTAIFTIKDAGLVLVPKMPTPQMQRAGLDVLDITGACDCDQHSVYHAMLAAAPQPHEGETPLGIR